MLHITWQLGGSGSVSSLTLGIAVLGMLALAAADIWRQEVEDWATAILLGIVVSSLLRDRIGLEHWTGAVIVAVLAFLVYLWLGMVGVVGGGDVKLAAAPALVLGAISPWLAMWWIAASLLVHQALFLLTVRLPALSRARSTGSGGVTAIPHVPAMALGMLLSLAVVGAGI